MDCSQSNNTSDDDAQKPDKLESFLILLPKDWQREMALFQQQNNLQLKYKVNGDLLIIVLNSIENYVILHYVFSINNRNFNSLS